MTSIDNKIGVKLSQLNIEEGIIMPARRCPYCKALSNFSCMQQTSGGHLTGWVSLDVCQNCKSPIYFVTARVNDRDDILDIYPKLDIDPDKELPTDVMMAFGEAMKALNEI